MNKILRIGAGPYGPLFCRVEITGETGKERLSITGVEGPRANGNAKGSCGQILDAIDDLTSFAPGWTRELAAQFKQVWENWHLNEMRAGCQHQHDLGWDKRLIDPNKPLSAYGKHFTGQSGTSWNMAVWLRKSEHPAGLLGEPCPVCGYRYGTAWLHEALPGDVVKFLVGLPKADKEPAWV